MSEPLHLPTFRSHARGLDTTNGTAAMWLDQLCDEVERLRAENESLRLDMGDHINGHDAHDRQQRAAAWDLGYRQCLRDRLYGTIDAANPYRADRIEAP